MGDMGIVRAGIVSMGCVGAMERDANRRLVCEVVRRMVMENGYREEASWRQKEER